MASMIWKLLSLTSLVFEAALFVFEGQAEFHQENKNTAALANSFQKLVTQLSLSLLQWSFILWTQTTLPKKCFNALVLSDRILKHNGLRHLLSSFLFNPQNTHHCWRTVCYRQKVVQSLGKIRHSHGHLGRGELRWVFTMHEHTCLTAFKPQSLSPSDRLIVGNLLMLSHQRGNAMPWHLNLEIASLDLRNQFLRPCLFWRFYFLHFLSWKHALVMIGWFFLCWVD